MVGLKRKKIRGGYRETHNGNDKDTKGGGDRETHKGDTDKDTRGKDGEMYNFYTNTRGHIQALKCLHIELLPT